MNILEKYLPINSLRRSGEKLAAVKFIVCHDTGNSGSTAMGNVNYFIKSAHEIQASAHYFVDDKNIIRDIPEDEKAWHVRYLSRVDDTLYMADANDASLGVELCYGGEIDNQKAYSNYCALLASLCVKYHLDPRTDLVAHQTLDASHRTDPLNAFSKIGKTWEQFIEDVSAIKTNAPSAPIKHMDITKETSQTIKIKSVTVAYDQYVNGELTNENHPVTVEITPELIAAIKPDLVTEGYNITVE